MFLVLFYLFLAYLLYNLVFKFIIPIYRTTRQVKKGFREMQERMQQHTQPSNQQSHSSKQKEPKGKEGEYIDFEEVKE